MRFRISWNISKQIENLLRRENPLSLKQLYPNAPDHSHSEDDESFMFSIKLNPRRDIARNVSTSNIKKTAFAVFLNIELITFLKIHIFWIISSSPYAFHHSQEESWNHS